MAKLPEDYQPNTGPLRGKALEKEKEKLRKRKAKHQKKYYGRTDRTIATGRAVGSNLSEEEMNRFRTKGTY